ncbi:hypothetical protein AMES_5403 [Amycolatopsis mediterranei S699]|uniref:Uncharacterized protein n=2 Tax=Amycolatopsis mediterranei TaxID=33910 RepID=A0A0H3DAW2_AMYMU|nr:hypothetical protein [Amycolatopsis mediterranei]ADJ47228.1 hypothetical protein AMED_5468 [Amycolatopsis mediterranei U32]AEK44052.1 hypothetical protein RAM_27875 [Amycolatopsis mediterranei S699]AFO78939.1 hypothetical protein AMES_5403 [Amycolatopsis mediterranei S699]AGT86067.1 hypothetical protein B737_5403 [Amycolatopsis mediterranei RB]KDO04810.1 hypothetical protein DV26_42155 [Amycolatopsis mediterranei]
MHVLLTEASFGDADFLVQPLRDADCLVSRCHSRAGLCRALAVGGRCPLDEPFAQPDLLVDVRGREPELTAREFGVVCAIRDHVPVALVSPDACVQAEVPPGLERRVTVIDVEGLLATCRAASRHLGG